MIEEADISQALGQRLVAMTDCPDVVWENKDKPASVVRPYLVVEVVRVSRRDASLKGGRRLVKSNGFLQVTAVGELDVYAFPSERLADRIAGQFPSGLRLSAATGTVTIMDEPDIKKGYRDGADWRVPVQIDYWAS
ncbi:hypothetical protein A8B82_15305 [Sulfitobacter sp. EhC04]|uniref:phage tail terminator-like protein n=1 Tax=Sulfitobacter sp. EhC04 TaxID=1849168 RepID=UPI0007F34C58|nr:phage tail terminator-like protein [Sulfitobacter sp. EhC04]OAN76757.1 hypothetical protein A8B82_15305 [Sulfitobacter sp. EhC04]